MKEKFTLLIADRNRNIREFLQRELITDGYRVILACDGRQVLKIIEKEAPDLLVIDPDIPYADELRVLENLQNANQFIPLLVHTLPPGDTTNSFIQRAAGFVEKDGNNITNLKDTITQVLRKHYPHRF
ncbi:MAG TPA: response regulator [Thermodesulfobacteriota bacterium]|nr:response regulator [Thermodesulfobacteriota bacterium]